LCVTDKKETKTGGCLCGKVRFRTIGPLRPAIACHCSQCRKTSGHYVTATSIHNDKLEISGVVQWYRSSERAQRGFCPVCGSNLFWRPDDADRTAIFAGTIDGETGLKTEKQLYPEDKGDYYDLPEIPSIEQSKLAS